MERRAILKIKEQIKKITCIGQKKSEFLQDSARIFFGFTCDF